MWQKYTTGKKFTPTPVVPIVTNQDEQHNHDNHKNHHNQENQVRLAHLSVDFRVIFLAVTIIVLHWPRLQPYFLNSEWNCVKIEFICLLYGYLVIWLVFSSDIFLYNAMNRFSHTVYISSIKGDNAVTQTSYTKRD